MATLNTLIFEQAFSNTSSISVTHNTNSRIIKAKVLIGGVYRTDLINDISVVSQNSVTITLKSAQTGVIQLFTPDLVQVVDGSAISPSSASDYIYAYDITTQLCGQIKAMGTVTLTGGASGSVNGITVNGVQIMSGAVSFTTDLATTAKAVAANIVAFTSTPDYSAYAVGSVITIMAYAFGTGPNGFAVASTSTTITTSTVNMAGGAAAAINTFTDVYFSNTGNFNGWYHTDYTPTFICNKVGQYVATVGFNVEKTGSGSPAIALIATKNGSSIVESHQGMTITSNNTSFALSRTFIFSAAVGDDIRVRTAVGTAVISITPAPDPTGVVSRLSASITITRLS